MPRRRPIPDPPRKPHFDLVRQPLSDAAIDAMADLLLEAGDKRLAEQAARGETVRSVKRVSRKRKESAA